jgi:hypothetical protein
VLKITPYEIMELRCQGNLRKRLDNVQSEFRQAHGDIEDYDDFCEKHPLAIMDAASVPAGKPEPNSIKMDLFEHYLTYLFWLSNKPIYRIPTAVLNAIREQPIDFSRADYEPLDSCCYITFDPGSVVDRHPVHGAYVHEEVLLLENDILRTLMILMETEYEKEEVQNYRTYVPFVLPADINTRVTDEFIRKVYDPSTITKDVVDVLRSYLLLNKQSLPRKFSRHPGVDKPERSCPCCGARNVHHGMPRYYGDIASTLPYYEVELMGGTS